MNTVYKVIWNTSLGSWVAVSELAKSGKKSKSVKMASLISIPLIIFSMEGYSATITPGGGSGCANPGSGTIVDKTIQRPSNSAIVDGSGTWSLITGCGASGGGHDYVTAIGSSAVVTGNHGVAVGTNTQASLDSVALGSDAWAVGNRSVALGISADTSSAATNSVAVGFQSNTSAANSIAIGSNANASVTNSIALGAGTTTTVASGSSFLTNKDASTSNGVVSFGSDTQKRRLQNLADGSADQDAVTVAQLKVIDTKNTTLNTNLANALGGGSSYNSATDTWTAPTFNITNPSTGSTTPINNVGDAIDGLNTAVNSPITFKDAGTGSSVNKLGSEFAIVGDDNITTTVTDGQAAIALNKDLKALTSVETTDGTNTTTVRATGTTSTDGTNTTVYGPNGLNINNGSVTVDSSGLNAGGVIVSKDGINANDKVISNVGNASDSKDATNLGQVENLIADATGSITSKGFALTAQDGNTVNRKLGEAIEIEGDENISTSVKDDKIAVNLAKDLKVDSISAGGSILNSNGLLIGNTTVTSNGVYIQNGPSISSNGIDAGNKTISNIAAGVNAGDAVNKGQFDEALNDIKNNIGGLTDSSVQYDKNTDGSVNKDSISLGGSDGTLISNVADGKVETGSKDAINGGQLADVRDDLQGQINVNTSDINSIKNEINNGSLGLVKQDKDTSNINVAKDTGGKKVDMSGTDGNRVVTGVADGNIAKGSSDAVTGNQLNTTYENLANSLGGGAQFENGNWTGPNYTIGQGENSQTVDNVGDAVTALNNADKVLDSKIDNLGGRLDDAFRSTNNRIDRLEKDTKAAVASAIAIASLPQPIEKGRTMLSAGTGVWEGQVGVSIGASGVTEDKKIFDKPVNYVWKFASTTDSQGNWGGGASVGVQWK